MRGPRLCPIPAVPFIAESKSFAASSCVVASPQVLRVDSDVSHGHG